VRDEVDAGRCRVIQVSGLTYASFFGVSQSHDIFCLCPLQSHCLCHSARMHSMIHHRIPRSAHPILVCSVPWPER
jgi:hypothetical protein